jgi:hypothetical protein
MKKEHLVVVKSLLSGLLFCFLAISCEKTSLEVPYFEMRHLTKYQKDSLTLEVSYNERNSITGYKRYINNSLASQAYLIYKGDNIQCAIDGVYYSIFWENIKGGVRVTELTATINGAQYFTTNYTYNEEGRLIIAAIHTVGGPFYVRYEYEGSTLRVIEMGEIYVENPFELGNEENTGNVCNVLGLLDLPLTNKFVIIPELYYLNIYGAPIRQIPADFAVSRTSNSLRVGDHYYEFK